MNLEAKLFPRAIFILLAPQSIISITISSRSAGVIANYDAKINGNVGRVPDNQTWQTQLSYHLF